MILGVEGRQHPVSIMYTAEPVRDYVQAAAETVLQLHKRQPMPGDVLVFVTGRKEVNRVYKAGL